MSNVIKTVNGSVPGDNLFGGSFDVQDVATVSTKIVIPGTNTFVQLTNDGLGAQTINTFAPIGITELWDTVNDEFDFSQLKLGDILHIRADLDVIVASPNTQVELQLEAGIGVFAFPISWDNPFYGSAGTFSLVRTSFLTMQTTAVLTGKAEFQLKADKACTIQVNGWNYFILRRG
jgi:hypothetical protein